MNNVCVLDLPRYVGVEVPGEATGLFIIAPQCHPAAVDAVHSGDDVKSKKLAVQPLHVAPVGFNLMALATAHA